MKTETLSIKVSRQDKNRLRHCADQRGTTPSDLLREALQRVIAGTERQGDGGRPSLYDQHRHLFVELDGGPADLATNPKHLAGLGK